MKLIFCRSVFGAFAACRLPAASSEVVTLSEVSYIAKSRTRRIRSPIGHGLVVIQQAGVRNVRRRIVVQQRESLRRDLSLRIVQVVAGNRQPSLRVIQRLRQIGKIPAAFCKGRYRSIEYLRGNISLSRQVEEDELLRARFHQSGNERRPSKAHPKAVGHGRRFHHLRSGFSQSRGDREWRRIQRSIAALIKDRSMRLCGIESSKATPTTATTTPTTTTTSTTTSAAGPSKTAPTY